MVARRIEMSRLMLIVVMVACVGLSSIPVFGQTNTEIPSWFKGTAAWWSEGLTSDDEMISALEMLIDNNIIQLGNTVVVSESEVQENPFGIEEDNRTLEEKYAESIANLDRKILDQKELHKTEIDDLKKEMDTEQTEHIKTYTDLSTKWDKLWAEYTRLYGQSNEVRELTNPDDFK